MHVESVATKRYMLSQKQQSVICWVSSNKGLYVELEVTRNTYGVNSYKAAHVGLVAIKHYMLSW